MQTSVNFDYTKEITFSSACKMVNQWEGSQVQGQAVYVLQNYAAW